MALMSILQYQILEHIGYCTVNGFRIPIPYLIKDLGDMIASPFPLSLPKDYTLPGSINMDFNSEEDIDVLGCLPRDEDFTLPLLFRWSPMESDGLLWDFFDTGLTNI